MVLADIPGDTSYSCCWPCLLTGAAMFDCLRTTDLIAMVAIDQCDLITD